MLCSTHHKGCVWERIWQICMVRSLMDLGKVNWKHSGKDSLFFVAVVQLLSCVRLFVTPWTIARQTSLTLTIFQILLKLTSSWWYHPITSTSVVPFSSCLHSFLASGSFPMSWFFTSGSQSIGASVTASVLPVNIQGWFAIGLIGLISLLSKRLSRVFSNTTIQKH